MKTVAEAIQAVQSLYSRGVQSDDTRLVSRHIWDKLIRARATLLQQKANKKQPISQYVYQTIGCIELIPAEPYECPCVPMSGCKWLRSKYPFPAPIISNQGELIQSVTSLDGSLVIDASTFQTNKYAKGNKYTSIKPRRLLYNGYLFVASAKKLRVIQATLIANDPTDVWNYPSFCPPPDNCEECCMSILDREFPLDNETTETATQMAASELISIFTQLRKDNNNDAADETVVAGLIHQPK